MNISLRFSNAKHTKHVIARAIVCSMLLVLSSCKTPALREAEPGPDLPPGFNGPTSSEKGPTSSEKAATSSENGPTSSENGPTTSKNSAQLGIEEFYNDPLLTRLIQQALL